MILSAFRQGSSFNFLITPSFCAGKTSARIICFILLDRILASFSFHFISTAFRLINSSMHLSAIIKFIIPVLVVKVHCFVVSLNPFEWTLCRLAAYVIVLVYFKSKCPVPFSHNDVSEMVSWRWIINLILGEVLKPFDGSSSVPQTL